MKTLAYIFKNYNSPVITIEEACRRKKKLAGKWENWTYYDVVKLRPMSASCRTERSSSFSFLGDKTGAIHSRGSKGIAHELVQQYICNLEDRWSFRIFGKTISLEIESIEDEYRVIDPETGQNRFIDVMIHLKPTCAHYDKFNGKLGIEVTDTSMTTYTKARTFERLGLNVLELTMINDWHIKNKEKYEKGEIVRLRGRIKGFLAKNPVLSELYLTEFL